MKKRLISLLAVFCLMAAMVPAPVRAATTGKTVDDLVEYIAAYGTYIKDSGAYKIEETKTINGNKIKTGITSGGFAIPDQLRFWLQINEGTQDSQMVSFDYDITNHTTSSIMTTAMYRGVPPYSYNYCIADFDIGSYTANSTLSFEKAMEESLFEHYTEDYNEWCNALVRLAVPCWGLLLTKAGVTLADIGFDSYEASISDPDSSATYTITTKGIANGSVTAKPSSSKAGETVALMVTPNSGYQLVAGSLKVTKANGETVSVTGSGTSYTFIMPADNVTVAAQFEKTETGGGESKATYTVTFNANGGSVSPTSAVTGENGKLSSLPTPTRDGYTFDGWYTAADGGDKVTTAGTVFTKNTTIYAKWSKNQSSAGSASLTGYVDIEGEPWVGETLYARVRNTNNTGTLYYQWTADGYNLSGETSRYLNLTRYEVGKIIRCVVTSSVQTGSITGRLWDTVDYYDSRYYPPNSSTNNNTSSNSNNNNDNNTSSGTNQSGNSSSAGTGNNSTIDSPTFTTTANADGTKTTTVIEPDGSSGLILLTSYGTVSSASMTFSSSAYASAQRTGTVLTVPTTVQASRSTNSAAPVRIVLPSSTGSVKVKIPVAQMTAGTVAVMENVFGPDTIIKSSVSQSDGVVFELTGSAVVKVVDNSRSFSDVFSGAWYANAVGWASSRGVMNGVSPQMFDPQGTMNRAMMAQMLYNFDEAEDTGVASQFSDVSSKDWYAASVSWAARKGIARNDGKRFGAEDALTREDMALMLYNYAKTRGYSTNASGNTSTFPDSGDVSDWARSAIQWAVGAGLINGTQNGTRTVVLDPQGTVTRAQLATIMQRFNNMATAKAEGENGGANTTPNTSAGRQSDHSFYAALDFTRIKRQYSQAVGLYAYVTTYTNKQGHEIVLTDVWYKIISNYNELTYRDLTTGTVIRESENEWDKRINRAYGQDRLNLMDERIEMLDHYSKELTEGVYIGPELLN